MVVGTFEPAPPKPPIQLPDGSTRADRQPKLVWHRVSPLPDRLHGKIALTIAAMVFVLPGYRQFPFRISPLAIVVGVVGVVLWIWLCHLQIGA